MPASIKGLKTMLREWFAVGLGGMLGALTRHALATLFALIGHSWLPIATLAANVLGCLAIGILAQWSMEQQLTRHWWVVGLRVGVFGGLTTFSSFALDLVRLWQDERTAQSLGLLLAHLLLGIAAVVVGMALARTQPLT
jgi:CrcB protein